MRSELGAILQMHDTNHEDSRHCYTFYQIQINVLHIYSLTVLAICFFHCLGHKAYQESYEV